MSNCKPVKTPIEEGFPGEDVLKEKLITDKPFKELIGCLMYLMNTSRPDLSLSVNKLSRFQRCPTESLWKGVKRILRYLQSTVDLALLYPKNSKLKEQLVGFADADWAGDTFDRKSTSGFMVKLFGATVTWTTRKQNTVALSSTEAELVSLCELICDLLWIVRILLDLDLVIDFPITLFEDNQSCIRAALSNNFNKRLKHVDVKYHFICDLIKKKEIFEVKYLSTNAQTADILTKPLGGTKFCIFRESLGLSLID
ncbi:secreted RxLR effector protein 161-like [Solenopsis invicta]|uniref:secreted RxLR effector protein 161-like n=1 Tax=Solenopsis invicta TaxID=13686 RepID=UPI00193E7589|nr:secreted RxLR effector protein 161-like [Solenopsis invicta]